MTKRRKSINPPLNIYRKIALSFIVLTLFLIAVIFYFTLSYAYINIFPQQKEIATEFNFVIVEDADAENIAEGVFQGQIINEELEGEKTFTTTGTKQKLGDTVGKVILTNNLSREQILVATTRLLTPDGVLFRLKDRVVVPAGGTLEAEVYADDLSKELAVAGTKFIIPGLNESLQQVIFAETQSDFAADGEFVTAISQEELDKAVNDLAGELAQQIFDKENTNKIKILNKQIQEEVFSNQVGDEVSEFTISLKINVVGVMFDEKSIKFFAREVLEGLVSLDKELVATSSDNLIYSIEQYDLDNKLAQLKGTISGVIVISEDSPILDRDKLIKLNFEEIQDYLENFEDIESVEIGFFPSWIKKVPYFQDHIIIRVNK